MDIDAIIDAIIQQLSDDLKYSEDSGCKFVSTDIRCSDGWTLVDYIKTLREREQTNAELLRIAGEALKLAQTKMAHSVKCLRLLPTVEWTAEKGNRDDHCECEIAIIDKALAAIVAQEERKE